MPKKSSTHAIVSGLAYNTLRTFSGVSRWTSQSTVCAAAAIIIFFPCNMDIRALIHKPAEAVVIHACRIRHVYFALVLMTFLVPWQLGAMTDSEEEMILINDVALLDSRLKKAGCPCDETMFSHLSRDFAGKPFAKRMQLWKFRKDMRQTLLDDMLSHSAPSATAGETAAATSPPVLKQEQESRRKRKFEEPPVVVDRQTNSFIENSIEAGILLGGNGILHAMLVARAVSSLQRTGFNHS